jgi:hypothetical protein
MTESEWLECEDPELMLECVRGNASERKVRLFACFCCRTFWNVIVDADARQAVIVSERYADGLATASDAQEALALIGPKVAYCVNFAGFIAAATSATLWADAVEGAIHAARVIINTLYEGYFGYGDGWQDFANALRCIFGNSFRPPPPLPPSCLTPEVTNLATTIYEQRSFARLPEFADALAAAGCTEAEVLEHLRSKGPHARGCWAVDAVLGKT